MKKIIFLAIISWLQLYAIEPTAQPTSFASSSIRPWTFNISFVASPDADGYLVLRSTSPITAIPTDGVSYSKGGGISGFPNVKVFSTSGSTFVQIKEVRAGTTYYFAIFAYSGSGSGIDYLATSPLTGTVSTPDNLIGTYWDGIDQNASNFTTLLKNKIQSTHLYVDYSLYDNNIIPAVYERDTIGSKKVITCDYSGYTVQYNPPFNFVTIDFSREHALSRSWMPPGSVSTSDPAGADYHNLLPTKLGSVNSLRSNYPMGEVVTPTTTYLQGTLGYDANGDVVYEPKESIKGDVARCMFYQNVAWNGIGGAWGFSNLSSIGPTQDIDLLLTWHNQDLPDSYEKTKTEYIFFIQKDRNPFIDHPEWVDCINFSNLTRIASCFTTIGVEDETQLDVTIFPNPTTDFMTIQAEFIPSHSDIIIEDLQGKVVLHNYLSNELMNQNYTLDLSIIPNGIYLLKIKSQKQLYIKRIIINK